MYCRFWIVLLLSLSACQLYEDELLRVAGTGSGQGVKPPDEPSPGEPQACTPNPDGQDSACPEVCPEQCNGRDDDCDGDVDEGAADASCAADSADSVCFAGRCQIVGCLADTRDCDGLAANGCETLPSDPNHCGSCGRRCALANADSVCNAGACELDACQAGFGDCDDSAANGCETALRSATNCGSCGNVCGAGTHCEAGACQPDEQEPGEVDCSQVPYAGNADECRDLCPEDPDKREPGRCGCGVADVDSDSDGTVDCLDACPNGSWTVGPCLPYTPANIDPTRVDFANATPAIFNCGVTTLDTTPDSPVLSNGCGVTASITVQAQADGSSVAVLAVRDLTVAVGSTLRLVGARPVVLAVLGDARIEGTIDASAQAATPGAGGDVACGTSLGLDGSGHISLGGGGGGGGGYGTPGGAGGTGDGARAGSGGAPRGNESLVPLVGGCGGGIGGGCSARAAGGGAVQLSAGGQVNVLGAILAHGAAGITGCGSEGGGSGGGSGGAVFIEARSITAVPLALAANGGRGGDSSGRGGEGATAPTITGFPGESHFANGGGGGGGGFGRVRTLVH
jgi:hypothetical protein